MSSIDGLSNAKAAEVSMVIIRANGKREDLGVVSYINKNPLKQLIFKIKQALGIKVKSSLGNNS
jgi:hypothetical protein